MQRKISNKYNLDRKAEQNQFQALQTNCCKTSEEFEEQPKIMRHIFSLQNYTIRVSSFPNHINHVFIFFLQNLTGLAKTI